jgi:hypothetical protein
MFFSPLFFSSKKRSGRSFGQITVRHRGGGISNKFFTHPNSNIFYKSPYLLMRFLDFSSISKFKLFNFFCFSPTFNKLFFITSKLYNSFSLFSNYSINTRQLFPFYISFPSIFFTKHFNFEIFNEDDPEGFLQYSPYKTNFKNITNGAFISELEVFRLKEKSFFRVYAKAFFSYSRFIRKVGFYSYVKLPSSKLVKVNIFSMFNFYGYGEKVRSSNPFFSNTSKAGFNRNFGRRPVVRGVAINPVDHPHGGRTGESRPSVSPWAQLTKGYPTVRYKRKTLQLF